jgi:hypothetical protein
MRVRFAGEWREAQERFVDQPAEAVVAADRLVESQWASGDDVSTEDLRRGLRRYRSFFERLLAA